MEKTLFLRVIFKYFAMKKALFFLMAIVALFCSCSTRVDLYADYKDIPIIYGLIDYQKDTNYIRINRAFCGSNDNPINANEVALIADSCNYPGKLDARIIELKQGYGNEYLPTGTVFILDTITIHEKDSGAFYSPNQKVYFTTTATNGQRFKRNSGNNIYRYRLEIYKDNDTVSSETGIVGDDNFAINTQQMSFVPDETGENRVTFRTADNASFYELSFQFNYEEIKGGHTYQKSVHYNFGTQLPDEQEHNAVYFGYPKSMLFNLLEKAIGGDTIGVTRHVRNCVLTLSAGGDDLYNFILVNTQGGGYSQTVPDYTNIKGGYGVFSSRLTLKKDDVKLAPRPTLVQLYGRWGFTQE